MKDNENKIIVDGVKSDYYPYYKTKNWHLNVDYINHSKDIYRHGKHQKGYDCGRYIIYDEYRVNGITLKKYKLIEYPDDVVKSKAEALLKYQKEECNSKTRFLLESVQKRCDRVYEELKNQSVNLYKDYEEENETIFKGREL